MRPVRRVVDSAAERIEDAAVNVLAHLAHVALIKLLRVSILQIGDAPDTEEIKVGGDRRADTGNFRQALRFLSGNQGSARRVSGLRGRSDWHQSSIKEKGKRGKGTAGLSQRCPGTTK